MADFVDHLNQAKHNLECAKIFLESKKTRDWAISAAFYSVVHFVEAGFTAFGHIGHTELSVSKNQSHHTFRQEQVRKEFPNCYKSYRKLRQASQDVRYLKMDPSNSGILSTDYYPLEVVTEFVNNHVNDVRKEIESVCHIDLS